MRSVIAETGSIPFSQLERDGFEIILRIGDHHRAIEGRMGQRHSLTGGRVGNHGLIQRLAEQRLGLRGHTGSTVPLG